MTVDHPRKGTSFQINGHSNRERIRSHCKLQKVELRLKLSWAGSCIFSAGKAGGSKLFTPDLNFPSQPNSTEDHRADKGSEEESRQKKQLNSTRKVLDRNQQMRCQHTDYVLRMSISGRHSGGRFTVGTMLKLDSWRPPCKRWLGKSHAPSLAIIDMQAAMAGQPAI